MKLSCLSAVFAVLAATFAGQASALDFKSIGAAPAVLYDAPSVRGKKVFVAPRNMPVEVILSYGEWSKVRDSAGDLSWVESKALVAKRFVIVKASAGRVHTAPEEASPLVFNADRGVLLEMSEPTSAASAGWVKVRHRDGQSGFVKAGEVWGE